MLPQCQRLKIQIAGDDGADADVQFAGPGRAHKPAQTLQIAAKGGDLFGKRGAVVPGAGGFGFAGADSLSQNNDESSDQQTEQQGSEEPSERQFVVSGQPPFWVRHFRVR